MKLLLEHPHFCALCAAGVLGIFKGIIDGTMIQSGYKIRHGLHLAVWAFFLIGALWFFGKGFTTEQLGASALSMWGISALMFRGTVGTIPGWEWDHMGTTAKLDRLLGDWFGEEAGRAALAFEWFLFVGGLIWYWVA